MKRIVRTSETDPLEIATVAADAAKGAIGLTLCPGKHDPVAMSGAWARDLDTDLAAIRAWGAVALVSLIEDHEFVLLRVPDLGRRAQALGLDWLHLPIMDVSVPGEAFESRWKRSGPVILSVLQRGERVVVHCRGGLGRSGLVAARMLVELGVEAGEAIRRVRLARPGAVEMLEQEQYIRLQQTEGS